MISVLIEQRIVVKFHMKLFLKVKLLITITTLRFLLDSVKKSEKKDPNCGKKSHGFFITALSVKTFLAKYNIPVLDHPPYSPDLAPCHFYLFPKVKSALKGTRFETVEAVKEKWARVMNELT